MHYVKGWHVSWVTQGSLILILVHGLGNARADELETGLRQAYEEIKTTRDPKVQQKVIQEKVWTPAARLDDQQKQKEKAAAGQTVNQIRKSKWEKPGPDFEQKKKQHLADFERRVKAGEKPKALPSPGAMVRATPAPSPAAVAPRRPVAQQPSQPSAPTTYTGTVAGGTVSEVIDFNPQPMKTQSPIPTPTRRRP